MSRTMCKWVGQRIDPVRWPRPQESEPVRPGALWRRTRDPQQVPQWRCGRSRTTWQAVEIGLRATLLWPSPKTALSPRLQRVAAGNEAEDKIGERAEGKIAMEVLRELA